MLARRALRATVHHAGCHWRNHVCAMSNLTQQHALVVQGGTVVVEAPSAAGRVRIQTVWEESVSSILDPAEGSASEDLIFQEIAAESMLCVTARPGASRIPDLTLLVPQYIDVHVRLASGTVEQSGKIEGGLLIELDEGDIAADKVRCDLSWVPSVRRLSRGAPPPRPRRAVVRGCASGQAVVALMSAPCWRATRTLGALPSAPNG